MVDPTEPNIVDIASSDDNFSILVDALVQTNLVSTLEGSGPFTVFAPLNSAFENLPEGLLASLTDEQLSEILLYHVLAAEVGSAALQPTQTVETASGEEIFITVQGGNVLVNGSAAVVDADILASNGVIHAIGNVLIPDSFGSIADNAQKRYFLTALVEALVATDLVGAVADPDAELTVFAPTNEAFDAISDVAAGLTTEELASILLYHVVDMRVLSTDLQGEQTVPTLNGQTIDIVVENGVVTINGSATVTSADVNGTNGVIHVIDEVLLPDAEQQADGVITLGHVGASAWVIEEINGEGASAEIGEENATLTLQAGLRYEIVNLGTGNHPFQLRDGNGDVLIAELGNGSLQDYEPANVVIDESAGTISFTLSGNLADLVATYNCAPHPSMEGSIVVNQPVL